MNKDATLTSTITGKAGDTWRKIGKGTFRLQGNGNNEAELNIGDGTTYLERKDGYAARHIRLASGRGTVVLSDEKQLKSQRTKIIPIRLVCLWYARRYFRFKWYFYRME
ncbi:peptidase S6 IgA endopeptidase [Actinobacillus equuli]|nr:peptidase S6 IgA endopeptidase [Actinobacillus equuli]